MNQAIYNFFYEHSDSNQWHIGLETLEDGGHNIEFHRGLITAKIKDFDEKIYTVNLKLNDTGNRFQWLECTCVYNKKNKDFCSHIITTLLHSFENHKKLFKEFNHKNPAPLPEKYWSRSKIKKSLDKSDSVPKLVKDHAKSIASIKKTTDNKFEIALNYNINQLEKHVLTVDQLYDLRKDNDHVKLPQLSEDEMALGFLVENGKDESVKVSKILYQIDTKDPAKDNIKFSKTKTQIGQRCVLAQNTLYPLNLESTDFERWVKTNNKNYNEIQTVNLYDNDFSSYRDVANIFFSGKSGDFDIYDLEKSTTFDLSKEKYFQIENTKVTLDDILSSLAKKKSKYVKICLLYTSPSPRDRTRSRMPSSA